MKIETLFSNQLPGRKLANHIVSRSTFSIPMTRCCSSSKTFMLRFFRWSGRKYSLIRFAKCKTKTCWLPSTILFWLSWICLDGIIRRTNTISIFQRRYLFQTIMFSYPFVKFPGYRFMVLFHPWTFNFYEKKSKQTWHGMTFMICFCFALLGEKERSNLWWYKVGPYHLEME